MTIEDPSRIAESQICDNQTALSKLRQKEKIFLENVIRDAVTYTEHAKSKTVTAMKEPRLKGIGIGVSGGAAAVVLVVALAAVTPGDWVGIGSWVAAAAVDVGLVVVVCRAHKNKVAWRWWAATKTASAAATATWVGLMLYVVGATHPFEGEWVGVYVGGGAVAVAHTVAALRVAWHFARASGGEVGSGGDGTGGVAAAAAASAAMKKAKKGGKA